MVNPDIKLLQKAKLEVNTDATRQSRAAPVISTLSRVIYSYFGSPKVSIKKPLGKYLLYFSNEFLIAS
jgi:hypothetical protein